MIRMNLLLCKVNLLIMIRMDLLYIIRMDLLFMVRMDLLFSQNEFILSYFKKRSKINKN